MREARAERTEFLTGRRYLDLRDERLTQRRKNVEPPQAGSACNARQQRGQQRHQPRLHGIAHNGTLMIFRGKQANINQLAMQASISSKCSARQDYFYSYFSKIARPPPGPAGT
ncbi:hypothetical protein D3C83_49310 [compost metagenome]